MFTPSLSTSFAQVAGKAASILFAHGIEQTWQLGNKRDYPSRPRDEIPPRGYDLGTSGPLGKPRGLFILFSTLRGKRIREKSRDHDGLQNRPAGFES